MDEDREGGEAAGSDVRTDASPSEAPVEETPSTGATAEASPAEAARAEQVAEEHAEQAAEQAAEDPEASPEEAPAEPDELPGHADCVIVPLSNPETAEDLLLLAVALASEDGRVLALSVVADDAQAEQARIEDSDLAGPVDRVAASSPGTDVQLVVQAAPSVARGVLEVVRESGGDLLVLGVQGGANRSGASVLGGIADSVIDVAPCDVLVVRTGLDDEHVRDADRVVVTVDGGEWSRRAARTAIVLGDGLDLPVDVVHVQDHGRPRIEGLAAIAQSLLDVPGAERVRRRLLRGPDVADTVLAGTEHTDLLLVGLQRETGLQRWLFGSIVTRLLERATGPVLVVARQPQQQGLAGVADRLRRWLRPGLTDVEQETLLWAARRQAGTTIDYVTLLMLSAVLATLGLVQDSVAVIIGAMLVAPLLGPLSAMALALVTARTPLFRRGLATLALGTGAAVVVSWLVGLVLPLSGPTEQMLLRGAPSLLDVGVAMASGLVGAYATARKDIPAALAGVAIAAALVPPICTIGLGIALGDAGLASGALLLFAINISAVVATGAAGFWWFGVHPVDQDSATRRRLVSAGLAAGLALVVVSTLAGLVEAQRRESAATQQVGDELAVGDDVELVGVEVDPADGDGFVVTATVRTDRELTEAELLGSEQQLADELGAPVTLRVVVLRIVHPPATGGQA